MTGRRGRAVPTLTKWVRSRSAVKAAHSVYQEKEAGLAPLRQKREAAGASLAAKYAALADEAETKMVRAEDEANLAKGDADRFKKDRDRYADSVRRLEAELGEINQLERRRSERSGSTARGRTRRSG